MDEELRRKADIEIAILRQEFKDFRTGYEKDIARVAISNEEIMKTLKDHDSFIKDIKPMYQKGMMAWGAFVVGSIGVGVHWLWRHIFWGP